MGSAGALDFAKLVKSTLEKPSPKVELLYTDKFSLIKKIKTVATELYHAGDISFSAAAKRSLREIKALGFAHLPVCIAKTPYSFSSDKKLSGAPEGFTFEVREVRLSAGAGFVVAVCGDLMTMPGLPRKPAALEMGLDKDGNIIGLS